MEKHSSREWQMNNKYVFYVSKKVFLPEEDFGR